MSASRRKRAKKSPSKSKSAQPLKPVKSTSLPQPPKPSQPAPLSVSASLADSTSAKSGGSRSARRSTPVPPTLPNDRAAAIREADDRQARFVAGVAALAFAVGVVFFFAGKTSRRLDPPSKPGAATISTPQKLADAVAAEVVKERSNAIRRRAILETSVKTAANAAAPDDVNDKTDFNAARVAESGANSDSSAADVDAVPTAETLAFVVELNSASKAELTNLPRVGEKLAERIIERREELGGFRSVDDLLGVKGIGEKTLDKMRPFCVVAPLDEVK